MLTKWLDQVLVFFSFNWLLYIEQRSKLVVLTIHALVWFKGSFKSFNFGLKATFQKIDCSSINLQENSKINHCH